MDARRTSVSDATVYARIVLPPIEVGRGNRVDAGVLRLPEPSRRYELRGVAVDATGVPVAGAFVVLRSRGRQLTGPVKTGIGGGFTLPVFEGQTYKVELPTNQGRAGVADDPACSTASSTSPCHGSAILAFGLNGTDQYSEGRTARTPRHAPALHRSVGSLVARGGL